MKNRRFADFPYRHSICNSPTLNTNQHNRLKTDRNSAALHCNHLAETLCDRTQLANRKSAKQ